MYKVLNIKVIMLLLFFWWLWEWWWWWWKREMKSWMVSVHGANLNPGYSERKSVGRRRKNWQNHATWFTINSICLLFHHQLSSLLPFLLLFLSLPFKPSMLPSSSSSSSFFNYIYSYIYFLYTHRNPFFLLLLLLFWFITFN